MHFISFVQLLLALSCAHFWGNHSPAFSINVFFLTCSCKKVQGNGNVLFCSDVNDILGRKSDEILMF